MEEAFSQLVKKHVTRKQIEQAIVTCNNWFTDNAYPCSRLLVVHYPSFINRTLTLYSAEPHLSGLRLVAVDANGSPVEGASVTTRVALVLRALGMKIGDVFMWQPAGFGSLMALGIFEFADAEVNVVTNERVELTLHVKERPTCRIEPGAGVTSDGRVYGDISLVDNNFRGQAQRIRLEWQKRLDAARAAGCLVFEDMRVGANIPLSFKVRLYRDANSSRGVPSSRLSRVSGVDRDRDATQGIETPLRYEKDRDGAMVELGYRPGKANLLLSLAPILERIEPNSSERAAGGSAALVQTVLQTSLTHVTRLPIDCPRFGHVARVENYIGRTVSGGAQVFRKTLVRLGQYLPVGNRASIAVGANLGFGSQNLPWHEQRSLGGLTNVRGYEYGELGRYKSFGTGRVELRVPLTRAPSTGAEGDGDGGEEEKTGKEEKEKTGKEEKERTGKKEKEKAGKVEKEKAGKKKEKAEVTSSGSEDDGKIRKSGNLMLPKMVENLPPLVGVLFGDVALSNEDGREPIGTSYGLGMRIGGVITVDWTRTMDGRASRIHFGLVDRNL